MSEPTLVLSEMYPLEFRAWVNMLAKCYDPMHPEYGEDGGQGITVDPELRESFPTFLLHIGPIPKGLLGP
jgi:hypothetical protein